jgi:glycosyltransferase involved in cell wall biosynthesis
VADLVRRVRRRLRPGPPAPPRRPGLSFGSWDRLRSGGTVNVCHPDWRGIRTATYAFGEPVIEVDDASTWSEEIVDGLTGAETATVVVQGFPPGSDVLLERARLAGMETRVVLHSSMAQHGAEAGEAQIADRVMDLAAAGTVGRVGFVKRGMAEAFSALGFPVAYVPNRVPALPRFRKLDLGADRLNVGVFAEPFWRKNVVTQLGAVALVPDARAHVMTRPPVRYLGSLDLVEHGTLPWDRFVRLQGSVDLNLYVTLSECHPLTPLESYAAGVPCLISPTSALFDDDPDLRAATTVNDLDDPVAIAAASVALLERRAVVVDQAKAWMVRFDRRALEAWREFVG